jgi:hypothetical protein
MLVEALAPKNVVKTLWKQEGTPQDSLVKHIVGERGVQRPRDGWACVVLPVATRSFCERCAPCYVQYMR